MSNPTNTFVIYDPRMDNHVFEYGDGQHVESPFRAKIPFQSIQTIYNDSPLVTIQNKTTYNKNRTLAAIREVHTKEYVKWMQQRRVEYADEYDDNDNPVVLAVVQQSQTDTFYWQHH